ITSSKSNKRQVKSLEREYEQAVTDSQKMVSSPSFFSADSQQSTTKVNARAARKAERLNRQIQRMSSQYLGKVSVIATHWHQDKKYAESQAKHVISMLMSGITPADKEEDMKVRIKKGRKDFEKALAGRPVGNHTILTPEEATTYFTLPQCDIGLRVSRREEFASASADISEMQGPLLTPKETPMQKFVRERQELRGGTSSISTSKKKVGEGIWKYPLPELILLGYTLRNGIPQKTQPHGLVRKILASHIGIYGNTGSGKTTTSVSLVAQAYRNHVIPIIITPGNVADWRVLKDIYPEFRIFTAGNPDISPLRYNMWDVPPGVPVGKYIDRMIDVYTAALPNDGVISMHFDDIFNTMYENCGWGRMGNVRGRPIVLADLYQAFQQVATTHISYGEEMSRDFYGAFDARIRSMLRNEILVDMFNTPKGLSISEALSGPIIIETRDLSPEDRALLTGAFTAGISEYFIANPKKEVSHLLVLEEAHHLLKRVSGPTGYAEPTSRQKAIDNFVEMLRIQRGNGLSLLLIDQLPGSMVPEAVKLPGNVIIHTLTDLEERLLVGRQALCTDAQINHIGGMGIGEAVIRIMTRNTPANIQILPLSELVNIPLPQREWNDALVRTTMMEVFDTHPELKESHPLSQELKDLLKGIRQPAPPAPQSLPTHPQAMYLSKKPDTDISDIVSETLFVKKYLDRIKSANQGNALPVARMLHVVAKEFCPSDSSLIPFTERLLLHAAGSLQQPKDIAILSDILVAIRSEST
ncbi:MAG: DUF87 domain-containing protein, partial [Candidatus Thorarchaeota archaeon]|nr:DUF87 domain-containing protein [Candidatus Thorarchaeota archaeon]